MVPTLCLVSFQWRSTGFRFRLFVLRERHFLADRHDVGEQRLGRLAFTLVKENPEPARRHDAHACEVDGDKDQGKRELRHGLESGGRFGEVAGTHDGVMGFSADAYRFEFELEKDSDEWQLIAARWGELGDELQ